MNQASGQIEGRCCRFQNTLRSVEEIKRIRLAEKAEGRVEAMGTTGLMEE